MSDIHLLARARKSFEQHTWADSYRLFAAADREILLEPEDLERLATAAYLMRREDDSEAFWERAHRTFLERGDREGAARSACWLAVGLQLRGAIAPASGWFARAQNILDEGQIECVSAGGITLRDAMNGGRDQQHSCVIRSGSGDRLRATPFRHTSCGPMALRCSGAGGCCSGLPRQAYRPSAGQ